MNTVKFSSRTSVFSACNRFANYYVEEILKEDKDNFYELRKTKEKLNKLTKDEETLTKIYCIYVSYANDSISEEEYTRLVEEFDLSKVSKTVYTNINSKKNNFKHYAELYATNYLGLTEKEFDSIGRGKRKRKLEFDDPKALPILEKIYTHYLEYLDVLITERELCDKAIAAGVFLITEKVELNEVDIKDIIREAVNYYFKKVLRKSNKEFLELKNNSLLSQNKGTIKSLSKYNDEAKKIMESIFTLIKDYYDLKIDYDTYIEVISDTDINKVTMTKLKYKLERKIELFKYYAKFYAVNFLGIDEDVYLERLNNSDIYKKSYQYYLGFCKGKVNISEFNTYETTFGINALEYEKEYALRNNLMDEFNVATVFKQKDKYARQVKNNRNYRFIMTLERNFILSDYCEMVDDYNLDLISLRRDCFDYLIVTYPKLSSDSLEEKLDDLRRKVDMVYEVISQEQRMDDKDVYFDAKELIEEYLSRNCSIDSYLDYKGISLQTFFNAVNELKSTDKKLFNRFREFNNIDDVDLYLLMIFNITQIVKSIKFGITRKDNSKRKFELFDYFKLLSSDYSAYDVCLSVSHKILDDYDFSVLETFINNNKNISINDEETAILSMGVFEDGRVIDNNEKITIINVMKINGVPVTRKLFTQAVRRYLDGELINTKRII